MCIWLKENNNPRYT